MMKKLKELFLEEEGQGMTEYGLILGLIAAGVVTVLLVFGPKITKLFENVNSQVNP
ncbi:Flp family type IVb pilin [Ectobacillus sp. sgz5001026]|jgi:pilus assembly protein Flp/PilA|uniref:Flp family type IVb pilin n=1 Tax=Ectobacillus sp. sgz5001026 TaxID=3242473 RepID=UPI0036D270BC